MPSTNCRSLSWRSWSTLAFNKRFYYTGMIRNRFLFPINPTRRRNIDVFFEWSYHMIYWFRDDRFIFLRLRFYSGNSIWCCLFYERNYTTVHRQSMICINLSIVVDMSASTRHRFPLWWVNFNNIVSVFVFIRNRKHKRAWSAISPFPLFFSERNFSMKR